MSILLEILGIYIHATGYIVHFVLLPAYALAKWFDIPME